MPPHIAFAVICHVLHRVVLHTKHIYESFMMSKLFIPFVANLEASVVKFVISYMVCTTKVTFGKV